MCELKTYGPGLIDRGYSIVPIQKGTKFPNKKNWQQIVGSKTKLKSWLNSGYSDGGVGVLTKNTPAIDIDVQDSKIVDLIAAWCEEHIGATVHRLGNAPKTLLVYRTDKPFTKLTSHKYIDWLGFEHKLEILGDGQQFVAYAVHPDTEKPYEWTTAKSLVDVEYQDLPLLTYDKARELISYFESIKPDDWEFVEKGAKGQTIDYSIPEEERVLNNLAPKVSVTKSKIQSCLDSIDPDSRMADWVNVGMALYHQFNGDGEGFELWDAWSSSGDKYNASEMEARWKSFEVDLRSKKPVTAATILAMGKQSELAADPVNKEKIDEFVKRYVYVEAGDMVCDLKKPPFCSMSKFNEFRNRTANVRHEVSAPTKQDPEATRIDAVWKAWMVMDSRKSAEGVDYNPSEGRIIKDRYGLRWVNEFYAPKFEETDSKNLLNIFHEHMMYLFPIDDERSWFVQWMAFNLQQPGKRCKVTPLHVSTAHGTGRGWIVELMEKLLGDHNCTKTSIPVMCGEGSDGQFQDYLHKSLLCCVEEVKEAGGKRYSISDSIRSVLTEDRLPINLKYGGKGTRSVYTNFFFMSNNVDALVIPSSDRRINVFTGPADVKELKYYDALYAWLDSEGVDQLASWLKSLDLSEFNWQHSFATEGRKRMVVSHQSETESLFMEMLSEIPSPVMTLRQMVNYLNNNASDEMGFGVDETQLTRLVKQNFTKYKSVKVSGKVERPWILDKKIELDNEIVREVLVNNDTEKVTPMH